MKAPTKKDLICYCFGYSEEDIFKDVLDNKGASIILERIVSEKKRGGCNCEATNPFGR
jgi:hypothetical protein